jgi:uncharacterized membrane-anchored protein YjiN (DUF445 family)
VVGGLADWFAVTALFRRPLGLPIPHTALIPANWERLAERVGTMVGSRVLTPDYVTREVMRVDIADLLARAADRIRPADLEAGVRAVVDWAAAQMPPESAADLTAWARRLLVRQEIAPVLADAIDVARRHGWDQRAIQELASGLVRALERPEARQAVRDLVGDVVASYRARAGTYPGLLIGIASFLGLIDRDRVVAALHTALDKLANDPRDPLRRQLSDWVGELPGRLREGAGLGARVEAAKVELLTSPVVIGLFEDAARGLERAVRDDLGSPRSEVVGWIAVQLEAARAALASDAALRRELDGWLKQRAVGIVDTYQDRLAAFIERGVRALGPEGAVRLIEEHAGEDLQYIRVNGTVVGGLAGGAIYAVHLLARLL